MADFHQDGGSDGAESGKGAVYAWDGNENVGSGRMEIPDASPLSKITIKLGFFKPFEGHDTAEFTFATGHEAALTNVIWVMRGRHPSCPR